MTESRFMRDWYVPVEILTLRSWLVVSFIVHLLLLTVEVLRDDSISLLLGFIVCILFATLRASLPKIHDQGKRNISLARRTELTNAIRVESLKKLIPIKDSNQNKPLYIKY